MAALRSRDEKDLAKRIMEVNENPELAQQLSQNARLNYLQHYTPEKELWPTHGDLQKSCYDEKAKSPWTRIHDPSTISYCPST